MAGSGRCLLALQMQVDGVKIPGPLQPFPIQNGEGLPLQANECVSSKVLERSVDVNRREPEGIPELCLCDREITRVILRKTNSLLLDD